MMVVVAVSAVVVSIMIVAVSMLIVAVSMIIVPMMVVSVVIVAVSVVIVAMFVAVPVPIVVLAVPVSVVVAISSMLIVPVNDIVTCKIGPGSSCIARNSVQIAVADVAADEPSSAPRAIRRDGHLATRVGARIVDIEPAGLAIVRRDELGKGLRVLKDRLGRPDHPVYIGLELRRGRRRIWRNVLGKP